MELRKKPIESELSTPRRRRTLQSLPYSNLKNLIESIQDIGAMATHPSILNVSKLLVTLCRLSGQLTPW